MKKLILAITLIASLFLMSNANAMNVTLTCDPNTEVDLAGYKIYTATISGGPYTLHPQGTFPYGPNVAPTMLISNLPDVTTYIVATAYDTGGLESGYSNQVSIVPLSGPSITTQPANITRNVGQTATFSVVASGDSPLTYQWQMRTSSTGTWGNVTGATSASYTTAVLVATDSGKQFRCVVTNSVGSVTSNAATLTVNVAPVKPTNLRKL